VSGWSGDQRAHRGNAGKDKEPTRYARRSEIARESRRAASGAKAQRRYVGPPSTIARTLARVTVRAAPILRRAQAGRRDTQRAPSDRDSDIDAVATPSDARPASQLVRLT